MDNICIDNIVLSYEYCTHDSHNEYYEIVLLGYYYFIKGCDII